MPQAGQGPFREESLERLSSPERLDQLLRVVDRKTWVPLVALAIVVLLVLFWAVFGEIPVYVEGREILTWPREVVQLESPGSGYLVEVRVQVDDLVEQGDLLAVISRPDLARQLELQRGKEDDLAEQFRTGSGLRLDAWGPEGEAANGAAEDLDGHFRASRELVRTLKNKELQAIAEEREKLEEQVEFASRLRVNLEKQLEGQRRAHESEVISDQDLLQAEEVHLDSLARISNLETDLRALKTQELEVQERFIDRLQRITDREQQIADVRREIDRLEAAIEEGTEIVSGHAGRILEISAVAGNFLDPGDRVGSMGVRAGDRPIKSVTYFTVRDGKRVRVKDDRRIQITPDTVERQRFGGIWGKVTHVSLLPVSLAEAESVVGNRGLAEELIAGGYRMQVFSELEWDPERPGHYHWTSAGPKTFEISDGTTTTARVVVDTRHPITYVFPIFKSAVGID